MVVVPSRAGCGELSWRMEAAKACSCLVMAVLSPAPSSRLLPRCWRRLRDAGMLLCKWRRPGDVTGGDVAGQSLCIQFGLELPLEGGPRAAASVGGAGGFGASCPPVLVISTTMRHDEPFGATTYVFGVVDRDGTYYRRVGDVGEVEEA